jgi:tRNA (guanine37-N1)-methyltransferase
LPEYLGSPLSEGHVRIAQEKGVASVRVINLRDFAQDAYRAVDDEPYGGGGGMVLKVEPVWRALASLGVVKEEGEDSDSSAAQQEKPWVILPTPKGSRLKQDDFERLSAKSHLVFLCSRYKGIDERIRDWVDEECSLGDYVISGGEAAAMVMIEGIIRLLPGVVGAQESVETDSYTCGLLSAPTYTRPEEFKGKRVPEVLLSGHHARIQSWRRSQALALTLKRRPDLLSAVQLSDEDLKLLSEVLGEQTRRD